MVLCFTGHGLNWVGWTGYTEFFFCCSTLEINLQKYVKLQYDVSPDISRQTSLLRVSVFVMKPGDNCQAKRQVKSEENIVVIYKFSFEGAGRFLFRLS